MDQVMFLEKHNYDSRNTGELIWNQSHRNIQDFLQKIPADRQFKIIYEDLVNDPKQVMQAMCEKVGLPFHPNLLNPYLDIDKKMTDGLYDTSKPIGDPNLLKYNGIQNKKSEEWKKVKTDNFLHAETWKLAIQLGYESIQKEESRKGESNQLRQSQLQIPLQSQTTNPQSQTPNLNS